MTPTTIDYYTTEDGYGDVVEIEIPMTCHDCGRPALYDYSDESYHHAVDCSTGCFLISSEDRPDDTNHPLVVPVSS